MSKLMSFLQRGSLPYIYIPTPLQSSTYTALAFVIKPKAWTALSILISARNIEPKQFMLFLTIDPPANMCRNKNC
jgi:hypothetical protein